MASKEFKYLNRTDAIEIIYKFQQSGKTLR